MQGVLGGALIWGSGGTCPLGYYLVARAADNGYANAETLITGEPSKPLSERAVAALTNNEKFAARLNLLVSLADVVVGMKGLGKLGVLAKGSKFTLSVSRLGAAARGGEALAVGVECSTWMTITLDTAKLKQLGAALGLTGLAEGGQLVFMTASPTGGGGGKSPHVADWELRGPKGGLIEKGTATSGAEASFPKGTKLTFFEQAWYGHTEGKVVAELAEAGKLGRGKILMFDGVLEPCRDCQTIMRETSRYYNMEVWYMDKARNQWAWKNGKVLLKP
jgi:hypothetical protein